MYHKWERPLFILVVMVFAACLLILVGQTAQSISKSFPTPAGYEYSRSEARLKYADLPRGIKVPVEQTKLTIATAMD